MLNALLGAPFCRLRIESDILKESQQSYTSDLYYRT